MQPARPPALLAAVLGMLVLANAVIAAEPVFPELAGRVVDEAGVLSPQTRDQITQMLAHHEQATGEQVVVATVKALQGVPIEEFGVQLGRSWGIGQKGRDNGAILLVAPNERKVRIEVGYGLEGTLTDAQSRLIIEQVILPAFRNGDFNTGVQAGAAAMLRVLGGEQLAAPTTSQFDRIFPFVFIPLWCILFFGIWGIVLHANWKHYKDAQRRAHGRGGHGFVYSVIFSGSSGGGFSGGGGSFGGGGASGSW